MQLGYCNSLIGQNRPRVASGLAYTLYVDSVAGDDLNDGSAAGAPVQTLARAVELAGDNSIIGLKRGGVWRESLDLSTLTAPTVALYGSSGDAPEITGADVVDTWTAVGGTTNVWTADVAHDSSGTSRFRVFEDGVQLLRVADQATCDATPGSFVKVLASAGTPATIKIHTTNSDNPNSNGSTYEVTVRQSGIIGPHNTTLIGVTTGRVLSNNGSIDLVNTTNGTLNRTLAIWGSKHNLGMGSGLAVDCIAVFADATIAEELSNSQFVAFLDDGTDETAILRRCGVIGPAPGVDLLSHGNPNPLASVTLEQFWAINTLNFTGAASEIRGNYYKEVLGFPLQGGTVNKSIMRQMANGAVTSPGTYADSTITDCCILVEQRGASNFNEVFRCNQVNAVVFENCAFYCNTSLSTGNYTSWFANGNSDMDLTFNRNVVFFGALLMQLASGATYVGDYNVWIKGQPGAAEQVTMLHYSVGSCVTLAQWQTATGQDANSVWLSVTDQSRGDPNAFWLGVANDENDGPADGDWRINPNAKVYGGDDAPYTGTFADGTTAITDAGAQNHWDWNARASASGPPSAEPAVPASLAEAKEYILAPDSWDF